MTVERAARTIFISIPGGSYARDLLRSGLLDLILAEPDVRVVILSPAYRDPAFTTEFKSDRISYERLVYVKPRVQHLALEKCRQTMGFSRISAIAWSWFEARLFPDPHYADVFRRYQPCLVVTPTPGLQPADIPLLRRAIAERVPTLTVVQSWDNLVTKGMFGARPQVLAVWNERMKEEAVRIHHYRPEDVFVVGPVQMDHYFDSRSFMEREEFFRILELDPGLPLVTVATGSPFFVRDHRYLLDILLDARRRGAFGTPIQILLRLHPADDIAFYERYRGCPSLAFSTPGEKLPTLAWNPSWKDTLLLANIVRYSDVVVNVASTLTLEAALLDRPVVIVAFDPNDPPMTERLRETAFVRHYRYILDKNALIVADGPEALIEGIRRSLEQPGEFREGRRRAAMEAFGYLDGKAKERVADLILRLAIHRTG